MNDTKTLAGRAAVRRLVGAYSGLMAEVVIVADAGYNVANIRAKLDAAAATFERPRMTVARLKELEAALGVLRAQFREATEGTLQPAPMPSGHAIPVQPADQALEPRRSGNMARR